MFSIGAFTGEDFLAIGAVVAAVWIVTTFLTARSRVSILDDLGGLNIIVSFSTGLIYGLTRVDAFPQRGVLELLVLVGLFYAGLWLFSLSSKSDLFRQTLRDRIISVASEDIAHEFSSVAFYIFLFCSFIFFVLQLGADSPDERNLFAEKLRILDILRSGTSTLLGYILLIRFIGLLDKRVKGMTLTFFGMSFLSGSKSAALGVLHLYLTTKGLLAGESRFWREIKFIAIWGPLAIIFGMSIVYFYTGDLVRSIQQLGFRLFLSGDVYLYSYVVADYRDIFGEYDLMNYIFHPFLRLIGLKGYEFPIGCRLMELVTGSSDFGPNPHLPIVILIFAKGHLLIAGLCSFACGMLVAGIKRFLIDLLACSHWPAIWRLALFFACFESATIFIDFQLYLQGIISVFCVLVVLSVIYELRRGTYSVKGSYVGKSI